MVTSSVEEFYVMRSLILLQQLQSIAELFVLRPKFPGRVIEQFLPNNDDCYVQFMLVCSPAPASLIRHEAGTRGKVAHALQSPKVLKKK